MASSFSAAPGLRKVSQDGTDVSCRVIPRPSLSTPRSGHIPLQQVRASLHWVTKCSIPFTAASQRDWLYNSSEVSQPFVWHRVEVAVRRNKKETQPQTENKRTTRLFLKPPSIEHNPKTICKIYCLSLWRLIINLNYLLIRIY